MSLHRKNPKRDSNEREIINALEAAGATVCQLSIKGMPDLLVGYYGNNYLMEVKSRNGKLTKDQITMIEKWDGAIFFVVLS